MKPRERKPLFRWRVVLVIAVLYFAVIALAPLPDRLVLFPTTDRIDAGQLCASRFHSKAANWKSGRLLPSWLSSADNPGVYVLRFYGNADRADRWVAAEAEMWNNRAVEVWGMNYPGFGGSTGPARLKRLGPAALAAFDALKRTAGDRPIFVFGASLGTTTALHVAAHRQVAGLILHNPPALRQIILRQFGWWNLWLLAGPLAQKLPADLGRVPKSQKGLVF